jgi:hypothetical protein
MRAEYRRKAAIVPVWVRHSEQEAHHLTYGHNRERRTGNARNVADLLDPLTWLQQDASD